MAIKDTLFNLRTNNGLSQSEMAKKLHVTRQAVSRWENGDTIPGTDTLSIISKTFGISIDSILGQERNMKCQVCGSPLDNEANLSKNLDGTINELYCKWCYIDGVHKYKTMDDVINDVVPKWNWGTPQQMSEWFRKQLESLDYWKNR